MDPNTELGLEILAFFIVGVVVVLLYLRASSAQRRDMINRASYEQLQDLFDDEV